MAAETRRTRLTFKARLSIRLAWLLGHGCRLLPRRTLYWLADCGGTLVYNVFPTYRGNVMSNIEHVLGPDVPVSQVEAVARRVFQTSARNFCDLVLVPHASEEELRDTVHMSEVSQARLREAIAQGKGVVLVTAHFGAFDYVGQILAVHGYLATALTTRTVPEFLYYAIDNLRASRGVKLEEATPGGVRRAMLALRRGGIVALVADRDFFQSGRPATFFGRETTLPPGPARIARQSGAPIVAAIARRHSGSFELSIEPPFHVAKTADAEADLQQALQRIIATFERYIEAEPEQWVMFQRVWPEHAAPALRVFPVGSPLGGELLGRGSDETGPLTTPPELPTDRTESPPSPSPAPARPQAIPRE